MIDYFMLAKLRIYSLLIKYFDFFSTPGTSMNRDCKEGSFSLELLPQIFVIFLLKDLHISFLCTNFAAQKPKRLMQKKPKLLQ